MRLSWSHIVTGGLPGLGKTSDAPVGTNLFMSLLFVGPCIWPATSHWDRPVSGASQRLCLSAHWIVFQLAVFQYLISQLRKNKGTFWAYFVYLIKDNWSWGLYFLCYRSSWPVPVLELYIMHIYPISSPVYEMEWLWMPMWYTHTRQKNCYPHFKMQRKQWCIVLFQQWYNDGD